MTKDPKTPDELETEASEVPEDAPTELDAEEKSVADDEEITTDEPPAETSEDVSETEETPVHTPTETSEITTMPPQKASPLPLIMGGAIAALIGFSISLVVPDGWPVGKADTSEITAQLDVQSAQLTALGNRVDGLNIIDPNTAIAPLEARVSDATEALRSDLNAVQEQLISLGQRIETLEKRPIVGESASDDAVAAYERDVQALRDQLEGQRAEIEAILSDAQTRSIEAETNSKFARATTALNAISRAIDTGAEFTAPLAELNDLNISVPAALSEQATGADTIEALKANFTEPARLALDASLQTGMDDGSVSRVGGFLRRQLGMRSLTPREGDDANAVLSRAEFALSEGNVADALSELTALPESGQTLMVEWVAQATTYEGVTRALSELNTAVNAGAFATE